MHNKTEITQCLDVSVHSAAFRRVTVCIVLILLLLFTSVQSFLLRDYRRTSGNTKLTFEQDVPPMVRFVTVALGGFRGLIADLLWLHASELQEQRRFVELVQLSDWITALEPDNGDVWSFHAWNLAYNVSVMMNRPEDAWRWVRNGVELLRKQGITYNPGNAKIRRELAWMYQHKIGMRADSNSWFYRTEFSRGIAPYLEPDGSAPSPVSMKAVRLKENYSLDAGKMTEIQDRFGFIDWRVPHASAVYWAVQGLALDDKRENLPCCRIAYQSLITMIQGSGILSGNPASPDFRFSSLPNTELIDSTIAYVEEAYDKYQFNGIRAALAGVLVESAKIRYAEGRFEDATKYYAEAQKRFSGTGCVFPPLPELVSGKAEINYNDFR